MATLDPESVHLTSDRDSTGASEPETKTPEKKKSSAAAYVAKSPSSLEAGTLNEFPTEIDGLRNLDFEKTYVHKRIHYKIDKDGATEAEALAAFRQFGRILLQEPAETDPRDWNDAIVENKKTLGDALAALKNATYPNAQALAEAQSAYDFASPHLTEIMDWKYYWDIKEKKVEQVIPLQVGLTVKAIQQNDADNVLEIKATITLKLPIHKAVRKSEKLLENLKEEAKEFLKRVGLNLNKDANTFLDPRNCKLNGKAAKKDKGGKGDKGKGDKGTGDKGDNQEKEKEPKIYSDYSISGHFVAKIDANSVVDFCPFNIADYHLSVKLNALDAEGGRQKVKLVWASRTPEDFIQFQYPAMGTTVTTNDSLTIFPRYKKQKDLLGFAETPQVNNQLLRFHEVIAEVDEILICFHTKNNQIKNLTNIVLPCMLVPIVFSLSNDHESQIQLLMSAILAMVFTMPTDFEMATAYWYLQAIVLVLIAYCEPSTRSVIQYVSLLTTFLTFLINLYLQQRHAEQNKLRLRDLVKDAVEESSYSKIWSRLGLD